MHSKSQDLIPQNIIAPLLLPPQPLADLHAKTPTSSDRRKTFMKSNSSMTFGSILDI